jgi:hypothetical protein
VSGNKDEMSNPRKLFGYMDIKAISGNHALLQNNEVPIVGYLTDRKRYTKQGGCIVPRVVCFNYGTEYSDLFFFENMTLVYQAISIQTPEYLTEVYAAAAKKKGITPEEFVDMVLEVYVIKELGF